MGSSSRREAAGEWGGVLRLVLRDAGVSELIVVPPSSLKKWVIGHAKKGQSGKDVMALKTFQRWGEEFATSDECDAYCLIKAAEAIWRGASGDLKFTSEKFF